MTPSSLALSAAAQPEGAGASSDLPCVLLTGFDAFGALTANPSWLAASRLHGQTIAAHTLHAAQLPTAFTAATEALLRLLDRLQPALVVCTGVAVGHHALSLERMAINIDDARMPDNSGMQPIDRPVVTDGPAAYFTTLPIKAMAAALQREGLRAEVSQTAGTFVCNHVFYQLMHRLSAQNATAMRTRRPLTRGGFIHVPALAPSSASADTSNRPGSQAARLDPMQASMTLDDMVQGLRLAIEVALAQTGADIALAAGSLS